MKDVYDTWQAGFDQSIIKHKECKIMEAKSILDHNRKLLQALDDELKWVLSKKVNNYINFQYSLMLIVPLIISDVL